MAWSEWKKFSSRDNFYAEGTSTEASVTITGLNFQPDIVILWQNNPNLYLESFDFTLNVAHWLKNGASGGCSTNINSVTIRRTEDGFYNSVDIFSASTTNPLHWQAIKVTEFIELIPTMTSNTTPYGEAFASSEYSSEYAAWKAFDDTDSYWSNVRNDFPSYIGYKFVDEVCVKQVSYELADSPINFTGFCIQGSNNGIEWVNITTPTNYNMLANTKYIINLDNTIKYKMYRIYATGSTGSSDNGWMPAKRIQFYG